MVVLKQLHLRVRTVNCSYQQIRIAKINAPSLPGSAHAAPPTLPT